MARKAPPDRLRRLVDCATQVFIDRGYAHTQMADVAEAMGVAKGTLYLYVESKEALFDLVVRSAAEGAAPSSAVKLPIPTPKRGATLQFVRKRFGERPQLRELEAALRRASASDPAAELAAVVREIYGLLGSSRRAIKLMDRSTQFHPDLAALWFTEARGALVHTLAEYLSRRIRRRQFRPVPDSVVAARVMIETIATWAVHRHWDPSPQPIDDRVAEDTVLQFIVGGLIRGDA